MNSEFLIRNLKTLQSIIKPKETYNNSYFCPIRGFSIDSRSINKGEGFIAIKGQHYDGHQFIPQALEKGASCIIAERYLPLKSKVPFYLVDNTHNCLKSIVQYIRKKKNPLVYAITGSIGKTTTKEMLYFLLKPHCHILKNKNTENNFLGVAKTILSLKDERVMIVELGTNQKGEIQSLAQMCIPDIGIITFIKPVHLEGLGSLKNIFEEKISLCKANPQMKLIVNRDDPYLAKIDSKAKFYPFKNKISNHIYYFGLNRDSNLFLQPIKRKNGKFFFLIQDTYEFILPSYLEGFITNIMAAVLGARLFGLPLKELVERMKTFRTWPAMRMQMQRIKGFSILNDAYNANPYSFRKALKNLKDYPLRKVAVVADMLELGRRSVYYHKSLASQIVKSNFDYCLTFGDCTHHLQRRLKELGYKATFHFSSHEAIARFIKKKIASRKNLRQRYLIFLKGSRKMELEKVINYL